MRKLLQLKFYSFLSTKWGTAVFIIGLFFSFISILQILSVLLERYTGEENQISNWVQQISFHSEHKCIEDIDIVYTWVNGSDPRHIKALAKAKREILGESFRICNETEQPDTDDCVRDEETANRFVDNQELKYSLRSVEKFAPWVRHIYLVTNGQIPYWLNLSHPRISVVPHEEIFQNHDHLPTFSSPAIETHIHRIPGLSDRFIYCNDDTMFGSAIYPDDFYTESGGQKIFLAWPVPNCNEGCPSSWIGDGYCDLACNVSECDWDFPDCVNVTAAPGAGSNWNMKSQESYCATGCPDTWIGDRYCDNSCNTLNCGYDAGDCGIDNMVKDLHGTAINQNTLEIILPEEVPAAYFNLSQLTENNLDVTEASHDNSEAIRTAVISKKHGILTVVLKPDKKRENVAFHLTLSNNGAESERSFNVLLGSVQGEENEQVSSEDDTKGESNEQESESEQKSANEEESDDENETSEQQNEENLEASDSPVQLVENGETNDSSTTKKLLSLIEKKYKINVENEFRSSNSEDKVEEEKANNLHEGDIESILKDFKLASMDAKWNNREITPKQILQWLKKGIEKKKNPPSLTEENLELLRDYQKFQEMIDKIEKNRKTTGRKLSDMYGESLKYVNKLLNQEFGNAARNVPAHMPHMLQKKIIEDMQTLWSKEFEETSSHRLRSKGDMQYAFSYFHFLMNQRSDYTLEQIWDEYLDINDDGVLDDNEIRNLAIFLYSTPLEDNVVEDLKSKLKIGDDEEKEIRLHNIEHSEEIHDKLMDRFQKQPKNKFQVFENSEDVAFVMVGSNYSNVQKALDGIREKRHRFVCLNDNMNHSLDGIEKVYEVLHNFYESIFAVPSSFELKDGQRNEILHIQDLIKEKKDISKEDYTALYVLFGFIIFSLSCLFLRCCCIKSRRHHSRERRFMKILNAQELKHGNMSYSTKIKKSGSR